MSEWTYKSLGQLAVFQKGRKVETSEHPRDGFEPYLGATALAGGTNEFGDACLGIRAQAGDVLMLWDGERSGLVGKGRSGVLSSTVTKLTSRGEIVGDFLYYALDSSFEWIQNRRTGTGVPHVPKDLGRILRLGFPANKAEQRRIAEILGAVDEAIEATEALIAKQQQVKAGLMHDLFTRGLTPDGQLRPPPSTAPALYHETPLGLLPKDWTVRPLADFTQHDITYGIVQAGPHVDGGVPYVRTGDMSGDALVREEMLCTSPAIAGAYRRSEIREGEIVCAIRATVGKVLLVPPELHGANLTQGTARISPNSRIDKAFLLWAMRDERSQREISLRIKGTTFMEITLGDLRGLPIAAPTSKDEQREIGVRMNAANSALAAEAAHLAKLRQQKQGLMQALLTPPGGG